MALTKLTSKDVLKNWRLRINELIDDVTRYAIINHATHEVKYGLGTSTEYGHVKLLDDHNAIYDKTTGVAATPLAVKSVYDIAKNSIQKGEKTDGVIEADTFKGVLNGNATSATKATNAINDEYGHNIAGTYATKSEVTNILLGSMYTGSIKRNGTAILWQDILTDTNSSFLYQTTCTENASYHMPALNLKTLDGRVGFGTYQNSCHWYYFSNSNETNVPDCFVDLTSTRLHVSKDLNVDGDINCAGSFKAKNATIYSSMTIDGATTINNNISVTGDGTFNKNLTVAGTSTLKGAVTVSNTLNVTGKIHGGAGSNFNSDLYVNSSKNSLIIRNDSSNVYFLVSNSVGASWNSLRPFYFNITSGDVTMSHNVVIGGGLNVTGDISANKVHNAIFNDYAEFFEKGEETEVGDIVALDLYSDEERYVKASKMNPTIVGVHSDTYGHILGGEGNLSECEKTHIPVGLVGRVKTKIVGKIEKGEFVVLSSIAGVGCVYDEETNNPLDVIGVAIESSNDAGIKLIKIKLK